MSPEGGTSDSIAIRELDAKLNLMDERDLLVACISTGLGVTIIYAILFNPEWLFRLRTPRMFERNFGRDRAKLFLVSIGTILILLGTYLVIAPLFQQPSTPESVSYPPANHGQPLVD